MSGSKPTIRIGLVWHSLNSDNLGVGALTIANIAILRDAAERAGVVPEFTILGWKDPSPAYMDEPDVEAVGLRMKDFVKPVGGLYSRLRQCDLVLDIGAGDSFADIYGLKRFGTVLGSKILALLARRPLLLCPQTIGPFEKPWRRKAALAVLNRAASVATRDDLSTRFLREMGFDKPIVEASDVALRLPCERTERAEAPTLRVGINVSGLLFNGGYTRNNMFGLRSSYPDLMRSLLSWLTNDLQYEVHLVPHVISNTIGVEDDYRVNARLAEEFPGVVTAPRFRDPVEAKSYIAGMDFFAGARMHACIAAFSSGVPVLPMAYSRKFAGLFGTLGYELIADCRNDDAETIIARFRDALAARDELRVQTGQCLARGLERLESYESAVTEIMRKAAS